MSLTFALAQFNFTVGYIAANVSRIAALYRLAVTAKADLVVFSEMAITGYPPEDLALSRRFQDISMAAAEELARMTAQGPAIVVGGLWREGNALYNAVFLMEGGSIVHRQYKHHLPNYGVFDEKRLFAEGCMPEPVSWRGIKLGLLLCEDMWLPDVAAHLKAHGADMLISIHASPYETGKARRREQVAAERVHETGLPLVCVNQIGGQDELIFDGGSFVLSGRSEMCLRLHAFKEDLAILKWKKQDDAWQPETGLVQPMQNDEEAIYRAMMLGLSDFVTKNGFLGVVLGMSGGIDSALSAAVAVDALGSERVRAVMMPSPFTSRESIEDANECSNRLGIRLDTIPIDPGMQAFDAMVAPFGGELSEAAIGNNQTRLRSNILMAISQSARLLLLSTGNKSELATGYTTIYGDMCGHYSVLKDAYKTTVYKLAAWRNAINEVIPQRIITKAPSAELKPNQTDQDTLPPYDMLDAILLHLVEEQRSMEEVAALGFDPAIVEKVCYMLFAAEYKRRQAPPGVKISTMAFWRDRRYPLTSGWWGTNIVLPPRDG